MENGPVVHPETISAGYWTHSETGGWVFRTPGDDPLTPLFDTVWAEVMGRHSDANRDGIADHAQAEPAPYVYTDPVEDDTYPRITAHDPDNPPDAFPDSWSGGPTERDQAAIDAGNA